MVEIIRVLLDIYFIEYVDQGMNADETPLFTRECDGVPLDMIVSKRYKVSIGLANEMVEAARRELLF
jgi:hypothetical protein